MSPLSDLLGPTLTTKTGDAATDEALAGKAAVALYFSAHWCGPCRGFTPQLAKAYSDNLQKKGLAVVFVSSDKDEAAFKEYYGEQPWLALPFAARDLKAKLSKKFKVDGIPTLVILDGATGELITKDGREAISEDPKGEKFPWKPPTIWEALGDEFLQGVDGDTVDIGELKGEGKYIGLYFSAHWCPPCRQFTPELIKAYKEHLKAKNLEIIFVSSDRSAPEFTEYYGTMPWLAIPNGDPRKAMLSKQFGVRGIPTFAVVDAATGETIAANARGSVSADPTGADFPWRPKPLVDMAVGPLGDLNDELALCVFMEGCDKAVASAAVEALAPIAEAAKAAGSTDLFLYATKAGGPSAQIRKLCQLGEPQKHPQVILLDIPDEGGFYVSDATAVTAEGVREFLAAYKAGSLTRKQLS